VQAKQNLCPLNVLPAYKGFGTKYETVVGALLGCLLVLITGSGCSTEKGDSVDPNHKFHSQTWHGLMQRFISNKPNKKQKTKKVFSF
jgi:hypothetical protein